MKTSPNEGSEPGDLPASDTEDRDFKLARETAQFSALYQAWYATALEQTKAVFAISSAGVALALTLIFGTTAKSAESWMPLWLVFALVFFAISAWLSSSVFTVNTRIVTLLVEGKDSTESERFAGRLHFASRLGFGSGVIFLVFAAVAHVWLK